MLQDVNLLRIPGPSPIPPSVQRAMNQPMIGHRGLEASELIEEVKNKMSTVFGTKQNVITMTSSGTSGLEAAVVNTVSAGDDVLVIVTGAFGDRFAQICEAYQLSVHRIDVEWGEAANPEHVKDFILKNPQIKSVFMTYCETSTGVLNPIQAISAVVNKYSDALVIVDGVSCVGGVDTRMDEWKVDIFVTGSQKAMMLPPGLCFIAVSERAWNVIEANKQPRFYLDLRKYRNSLQTNSTPYTPGVSLLFGLKQVLDLFEIEGLENVYARHNQMMKMMRAGARALNIPLLTADKDASPTVTAICTENFGGDALRKQVKEEFGLSLAGGQQHLKGKIIRIGHMGYCTPADVFQIISIIEVGLQRLDYKVPSGQGIVAAQEIYLNTGGNRNDV